MVCLVGDLHVLFFDPPLVYVGSCHCVPRTLLLRVIDGSAEDTGGFPLVTVELCGERMLDQIF